MIAIKKAHAIIALMVSVVSPTAVGVSAYYKATDEFARKTEVEKMRDKIDRIAEDVAEIKGMLKAHRR